MMPCACVTFTCDCTHNIVDCPKLSAGQHVTLHMSLGFVSNQWQDWTLDLIPDMYNCPSCINSSLPEEHAQHRRKAVYKTKPPLRQKPQQQMFDSHSTCNSGLVICCICCNCQQSVSHRLHAAYLRGTSKQQYLWPWMWTIIFGLHAKHVAWNEFYQERMWWCVKSYWATWTWSTARWTGTILNLPTVTHRLYSLLIWMCVARTALHAAPCLIHGW